MFFHYTLHYSIFKYLFFQFFKSFLQLVHLKNLISNYLKDTVNNYVYNNKLFLAKDEAINKYRRENRLNEFILEPSLFQHVGIHSSLRQDIFNSDNNKRNVLDYQFGPFHSFSFMKEYGKMKISFDPIFWLS